MWRRWLKAALLVIVLLGDHQHLCPAVNGYLNIFISQSEVMKLMGLSAELFYVRDGAVNKYAMIFVVPVNASIYDLEFSWQSLTSHPLPYELSIEYDTQQGALQQPQLNIPSKGFVPDKVETFSVHLPCTGNVSVEVPISINLFVLAPPRHNDTRLNFKRNKICLKGVYPPRNQSLAPARAPSQGPALLGAVACALGLVLVVSLIASAMYVRARKQIRQDSLHTSFTTAAYGSHHDVFIRLDPLGRPPSANSGSYATIASLNKYSISDSKKTWFRRTPSPSPYATALLPMAQQQQLLYINSQQQQQQLTQQQPQQPPFGVARVESAVYAKPESVSPSRISYYATSQMTQMYSLSTPRSIRTNLTPVANGGGGGGVPDPKDKFRRYAVQPGTICCEQLIQEGTYGRVYSGTLQQQSKQQLHPQQQPEPSSGEQSEVLIKTVVDGASLTQVAFLLAEASLLCGVSHTNIHSPIAANADLSGPPQIAYPYPTKGNLKRFLQVCRETGTPLKTRQLVDFGLQVARGLSHLHSLGVLHRDISTRTCVLDGELNVRIGDTALSRDLFPDDYHCLGDNENRPIKWMAPETLDRKLYSAASDVWSLGVLLWELATLGAMPFEEVDPFEVAAYLRDGFRLGQPVNCPDEFYTVMSCCWLADHKQRPSLPQLIAYLHDFYDDLGKYI